MTGWVITIDAAGPAAGPELAEDLVDALPSAAASASEWRVSVTFSVGSMGHRQAVKRGLEAWEAATNAHEGTLKVVRVEAISAAEQAAELERPNLPTLLGVSELATKLGVSKARASELARLATFPRPVAQLAAGPVWTEASVSGHLEGWERKPGRPKRDSIERPLGGGDFAAHRFDTNVSVPRRSTASKIAATAGKSTRKKSEADRPS